MSYADKVFVAMCQDILENGTSTEGELVRPHWEDGTSAYTIKKFGVVNRYDLSKEFPATWILLKGAAAIFAMYILAVILPVSGRVRTARPAVARRKSDSGGSPRPV